MATSDVSVLGEDSGGALRCDFCKSKNLSFAWRRKFNLKQHGWIGYHEYWYCNDCERGCFLFYQEGENAEIQTKQQDLVPDSCYF